MRLSKNGMMALADEQASNYNANSRESGQAFYDDDNGLLTILTNNGQEFEFEVGQNMDVRDAKEAGIYDALITVHHALEARED